MVAFCGAVITLFVFGSCETNSWLNPRCASTRAGGIRPSHWIRRENVSQLELRWRELAAYVAQADISILVRVEHFEELEGRVASVFDVVAVCGRDVAFIKIIT